MLIRQFYINDGKNTISGGIYNIQLQFHRNFRIMEDDN